MPSGNINASAFAIFCLAIFLLSILFCLGRREILSRQEYTGTCSTAALQRRTRRLAMQESSRQRKRRERSQGRARGEELLAQLQEVSGTDNAWRVAKSWRLTGIPDQRPYCGYLT